MIDLSNELTPEFFKNKDFRKGSILIFKDAKGKETHLKIKRLNRAKQICTAEEVNLYTEDQINAMQREDAERIIKGE